MAGASTSASEPGLQLRLNSAIATRLPVEILLQIFEECVADDELDPETEGYGGNWIRSITQVCRYWRELALDYPPLWTNISFNHSSTATAMLQHARNAPISIRVNLTPERKSSQSLLSLLQSVRSALAHSDHTKEISIVSQESETFADVLKSFLGPYPLLESLTLRAIATSRSSPMTESPWIELPRAMFSIGLLPLRTLVLERCLLPFDEAVLHMHCAQLTHLELHCVGPFNGRSILTILSVTTQLETLVLNFLLPRVRHPDSITQQMIQLPRLTRLRFSDRYLTIYSILRFLSLPDDVSLSLQFIIDRIAIPPVPSIIVPHIARGKPLRSILMHSENISAQRGIRMYGWTSASPIPSFFDDELPEAKIDVHFARASGLDDGIIQSTIFDLYSALPLRFVTALTVARVRNFTSDLWKPLLHYVPAVTELCIHGPDSIRALCYALCARLPSASAPTGMGIILPNLSTLTIYEAVFRTESGARDKDFDGLLWMLERRAESGARLENLVLCYSDVDRRDIEKLADLVKSLVWDGSLRGRTSVPVPLESAAEPATTPASELLAQFLNDL